MLDNEVRPLLTGLVTHLPDLWSQKADSLTEFTGSTRNDFLTLIESDLLAVDYLPQILDRAQTLVAGYFLASVSLLVDVPGINVRKTLGKLSTKRDPIESVLGAGSAAFKFVGTESFEYGLPNLKAFEATGKDYTHVALESNNGPRADELANLNIELLEARIREDYDGKRLASKDLMDATRLAQVELQMQHDRERMTNDALSRQERRELESRQEEYQRERDEIADNLKNKSLDLQKLQHDLQERKFEYETLKTSGSFEIGRNALATIEELSNLSTGKTFDVTFQRDGNSLNVPVTIRLAVTDTDSESMSKILSIASIRNTFKQRWKDMRNGKLAFVKDLLFSHDLIAESRRIRKQDKSGFYQHMMNRLSKNFLSGLFSLSPSINNASAVLVVSQETADKASFELGGTFDDFKVRQKVFESTAAMLIFVVDQKWDQVSIYHRGIDVANHVSAKDLVRTAKGGGGGVDDIVNAYLAGASPA